ncbi:MAG: ATP-binding cassette domain-containing protein, partial [Terriglobales bacterium]
MAALLAIEGLGVELGGRRLLADVSFELEAGAALALVGGSGSGKTTLLRACLGLLPAGARARGRVWWHHRPGPGRQRDLLQNRPAQWRALRGRGIGWVPQEPSAALDPRRTALQHWRECGGRGGGLEAVGLDAARARQYPFQWSGGMQQRLLVAMALARGPQLLLADEPTSALDPIAQARLLELLAGLRRDRGFGMIFVTHDLAVAARAAEQVAVLHAGEVV